MLSSCDRTVGQTDFRTVRGILLDTGTSTSIPCPPPCFILVLFPSIWLRKNTGGPNGTIVGTMRSNLKVCWKCDIYTGIDLAYVVRFCGHNHRGSTRRLKSLRTRCPKPAPAVRLKRSLIGCVYSHKARISYASGEVHFECGRTITCGFTQIHFGSFRVI